MQMRGIMTEVLYYVAMAFISIGGIALIIGAIGLVRLPDVYAGIMLPVLLIQPVLP